MTDNRTLLKNLIQQKFVKIATRARIKDEDGKSIESEFCCLMRLHALYIALCDLPAPTVEQLKEFEILANSICGRDRFIYKPIDWCGLDFDMGGPDPEVPVSACDITYSNPGLTVEQETVCQYLDKIIDTLNYETPWIRFTVKDGLAPGKYEVGTTPGLITVGTTVNKTALNFYDIDRNGDLAQYARELQNLLPDQILSIPLGTALPVSFLLKGEYFDLERHLNQNLKAETELKWQTVWPCYYGVGPLTAMDDLQGANAFIQSLTKTVDCTKCIEVDVTEGNVLWYFFAYEGMKKHFISENAVMMGSYKGTFDGMRTVSMDDNNIVGGKTYGVIRTDQPGIRFLRVCVENMLIDEQVVLPETPIEDDVLSYETAWSDYLCVQEIEDVILIEAIWSESKCVQE